MKPKIVRKSSLNITLGQGSCLISDFVTPNSKKPVLVRVAGWILAREIIKSINMFYHVCSNKYWKKLDKHL